MMDNLLKINLPIGLDDQLDHAYSYKKNEILFKITAWNTEVINVIFYNPILFVDLGPGNHLSNLFINLNLSVDCKKKLAEIYGDVPKEHPYKLFQFYDFDDRPCYEIFCEEMRVSIERKAIK